MAPDRQRARADRQLARLRLAVADHQALAVLVALIDERRDVLVDLGLERRRDHPKRALPSEIIERDLHLVVLPDGRRANIHHWRAFLPAIAGFGLLQPGRYAAFLFTRIHNFWV